MKRACLIFICISITLIACASRKKGKKAMVPTGTYGMVKFSNGGKLKESLINGEINFNAKSSDMAVFLGCNRIGGRFTPGKAGSCKAEITSSTRMACPNTIEDDFKNNFSEVDRYRMRGDSLLLMQGNTVRLVLIKKAALDKASPTRKADGDYRLQGIRKGASIENGNYPATRITIKGKQLNANVGCNSIGGEFITEGNKVKSMRLTMTEMYCEEVDALEREFGAHLSNANRFALNKNNLEFYQDQQLLLVLTKIDD